MVSGLFSYISCINVKVISMHHSSLDKSAGIHNLHCTLQIHLFDIDVPGKICFQESETLSPGNSLSIFETRVFLLYNSF